VYKYQDDFDYDAWWSKVKDMPANLGLTNDEIRCILYSGCKQLLTPFDSFTWRKWTKMAMYANNKK
jgi:hypothetical protein